MGCSSWNDLRLYLGYFDKSRPRLERGAFGGVDVSVITETSPLSNEGTGFDL